MILTLYTETVIDSCHYLRDYKDGPCNRIHGHSWLISIWVRGDEKYKNEVGILYDFTNVKRIKDKFDHYALNDIIPFNKINPTAENISSQIYKELKLGRPELDFKVRVYETKVGKETYCECGDF